MTQQWQLPLIEYAPLPMTEVVTLIPVPDEAELLAISQLAAAQHLNVISDGRNKRLCSIVPNGWRKVTAMIKPEPEAA